MGTELSTRAKFGAAIKHQQKLADEHPELFEKAREIMQRVSNGDILFMAGLMVALQEGKNMAHEETTALPSMAPPVPAVLRRARTRS